MRNLALSLIPFLLLASAYLPAQHSTVAIVPAYAPGVSLWRNYSDPASDVQQFYTSNGTALVSGGQFVFSPNPTSVNLLALNTWPGGASSSACPRAPSAPVNWVVMCIKLKGKVGTTTNFTYTFDMYLDASDQVHYIVSYTAGSGAMWLSSNKTTGFTPVDITGNATVASSTGNAQDELILTIDLSLIPPATAWGADVASQEKDSFYTYRDYIYQVPGHPGTSPAMITGHVYEMGTNNSVAGANVSVDVVGYYTQSDSSGAYTLLLAPGTYNITVTKDGYEGSTVQKTLGANEIVQNYNLYLTPSGPIQRLGTTGLLIILAVVLSAVFLFLFFLLKRRRPSRSLPAWDSNQGRPGAP